MKRITLVFPILTLILILSLFGCGGAESIPTSIPANPQSLPPTAEPTPTVAPTATAVPKSVQTPSLPLLEAITSALEAQDEEEYQAARSAIADHLLAGTDPNLEFTEVSGDDGEEGGLYPLHLVISTCYFNEISMAFEEIYLPEDHAERCTDLADLLIEGGADVDLPSESVLGSSPLHLAATHGQLDLAELLIDSGASVNQLDQGGSTPLDSTAMARLTIASFALWGMDDVINESAVDAIADLLTEHGGISENPIPGESLALIEDNFDSDSDGMTLEGLLEGLEGIFEDAIDAEEDPGSDNIWVMNADGSGQTRLTESGGSDYQPSWSPDGTQIIFASDRESDSYIDDIWVMDADGSNQTRLTESGGYDYQPSWSPDGTQIVFVSDRSSTAATNLTPTPSKASAVFGNTLGDSVVNSDEILGMMPEYDDATLPVALVVVFDDGVDGKIWGDGRYTRCVTGEPCGHLSGPTIHGREVYVKTSGHAASDPSHHWHYAYIFLKQTGAQTWPIQYVVPSSQWMAHRYFDSDNPWGDWGDLVVTAAYD